MKRPSLLLIGAGLILTAGLTAADIFGMPGRVATAPAASPTPTATPTPKPPSSPLSIEVLRQYPTPGGTITQVESLAPRAGCATSVVSYPSDGLQLLSLKSVPSTPKPAAGYPVIILNHGYWPPASWPTRGTLYQDFINAYCNAGFLVLRPDYRGHGSSPGEAQGGNTRPDYAYDVLNLAHSVKTLPQADANRIGMIGHSMGGSVTLRAVVTDPSIKASVMAAGVVASLEDIVYNWPRTPSDANRFGGSRNRLMSIIGTPQTQPQAWSDASAINYVDSITGPVLIVHGEADTVVPVAFSQSLESAMTKAKKQTALRIYPGADHFFMPRNQLQAVLNDTLNFFKDSLR